MYNTVGETAGVTQDVGSDPTVGGPDPDVYHCCTLCGMELEEGQEEGWEDGALNGEERKEKEEAMAVVVCDLSEMSRMEEEDEEMDGEPDTTGDDEEMMTSHSGERREMGDRISSPTYPERKNS